MSSCVEDADEFDDLFKEKAVVNCVLRGRTDVSYTGEADVYYSRSLLTEDDRVNIDDAILKIKQNEVESEWLWIDGRYAFVSSPTFGIESDDNLQLVLSKTDGEQVTASCIVPSSNEITIDRSNLLLQNSSIIFDVDWSLDHEAGYAQMRFYVTVDYVSYRVGGSFTDFKSFAYDVLGPDYPEFSSDRTFTLLGTITKNEILESFAHDFKSSSWDSTVITVRGAYVILESYETHLAHHEKTCFLQVNTSQDPFSEPVIIYSNINGGSGIFGAVWENSGSKLAEGLSTRIW